jgi:hypothetical protein
VPKKPLEGSLKSFRTWPALDPGNDHQLQDGTSRHTRNVRGLPLPRTHTHDLSLSFQLVWITRLNPVAHRRRR